MTRRTMSLMFRWKLDTGDVAEAQRIIEQLRLKAVELGWHPVSEVIHLADEQCVQDARLPKRHLLIGAGESEIVPHEVLFFSAQLPADSAAFGLASYPAYIEGQAEVTPSHLGNWSWVGALRTTDVRSVSEFLDFPAALGVEVIQSFGGMVFTAKKNAQGQVEYDQRSAFDPDTF